MKCRKNMTGIVLIVFLLSVIIYPLSVEIVKAEPTEQWIQIYDGTKSDEAHGVAVDSQNNIIVTGYTRIVNDENCLTIKYLPDGTQSTSILFSYYSKSRPNGVTVDSSDNIIITGYKNNYGYYDIITVKYNSTGTELFNNSYNSNYQDVAYDVTTDSDDNIIVAGEADEKYFLIKYDQDGNELWNKTYSDQYDGCAKSVKVDSNDNIIVTGYIKISNINQAYSTIIANQGDVLTNSTCVIEEVIFDDENSIVGDSINVFEGYVNNIKLTEMEFAFDVERILGGYSTQSPNTTYDVNCQWVFKDARCQYSGVETTCDKTFTACQARSNETRFGGYPSIPQELVIKG